MSNEAKIRLGIVDDHTLFRKGMVALLEDFEGFEVVLEAENGEKLLERLKFDQPELILLDLDMPKLSGSEVLPILRQEYPDLKVLILTMHDEETMILRVMELGANGYLLKGMEPEELEAALRTAYRTGYYLSDKVSRAMLQRVISPQKFKTTSIVSEELTRREMDVLKLVCQERTNAEIAQVLFISPRTVEGHRLRIIQKIGAKNTIGMVIFAIKEGLVEV